MRRVKDPGKCLGCPSFVTYGYCATDCPWDNLRKEGEITMMTTTTTKAEKEDE